MCLFSVPLVLNAGFGLARRAGKASATGDEALVAGEKASARARAFAVVFPCWLQHIKPTVAAPFFSQALSFSDTHEHSSRYPVRGHPFPPTRPLDRVHERQVLAISLQIGSEKSKLANPHLHLQAPPEQTARLTKSSCPRSTTFSITLPSSSCSITLPSAASAS
jgi:hypothetical protein